MLAKAHKLDLRSQVAFFRTADRVSTEYFTLYTQKNSEKLLFQVIIARGVTSTAVERNALRRAVYDICAEFVPAHSSTKLSLVIIVRRKNSDSWKSLLHEKLQKALSI